MRKIPVRSGAGQRPNPLVFVMLNPSTADASKDDNTIRRCRRFAADNLYTGIIVVNLFAFRATSPADLFKATDPDGPLNEQYISEQTRGRDVCCAWGANAPLQKADRIRKLLTDSAANTFCLGATKQGAPRHPLYVKTEQKLVAY